MHYDRLKRLGLGWLSMILMAWQAEANNKPATHPHTTPWIRINDGLSNVRINSKGRYLSFTGENGLDLRILDLKTKEIYRVSREQVGPSYFWSPDGYRLFFRELKKDSKEKVQSTLMAYDCVLHQSVKIDQMPYVTGILTFDPRDLRMHIMGTYGIHTNRIFFPDERLARWQVSQRTANGKWLAVQNGIIWITEGGFSMRQLQDDGTGLESFDISPDGSTISWATKGHRVYVSREGAPPRFIGYGRDPSWHPDEPKLVYAGARMVGNTAINYDIRIANINGVGRFITSTQLSHERWPQWHPQSKKIIYTIAHTTDLFLADLKP